MGCTDKCWTPVRCPECGSELPPRGRSVPMSMHISACCEMHRYTDMNTRHLWSVHDSTRFYTDPEGWNAHAAHCSVCDEVQS